MAYNIEDLVQESFVRICSAMVLSEIVVVVTIRAYVNKVDHDAILSIFKAACLPCLPSLLVGLTNGFTGRCRFYSGSYQFLY